MSREALGNSDLLEWFEPHERGPCSSCGERACVSLPDAAAHFCLACGAVTVGGIRIDRDRQIAG